MTEPDYKKLFIDAMEIIPVLTERVDINDINPVDIPYSDAWYKAKNLEKWWRTQQAKKILERGNYES